MEERRRSQRTEMVSTLVIRRLDEGAKEGHKNVGIEIIDVSREGVGFTCEESLDLGAVYQANLRIWTQEVLHTCLRIVRIELKQNVYFYGAVFVGMSETDAARIEVYQTLNSHEL